MFSVSEELKRHYVARGTEGGTIGKWCRCHPEGTGKATLGGGVADLRNE